MKPMLLWFSLLLPVICVGSDILHKRAVLILPDQIECTLGRSYYLSGKIGFHWDETDPLKIDAWHSPDSKHEAGKPDHLRGILAVCDEDGKELELHYFVSIPSPPDGEEIIFSGERRQFGFFIWNGGVAFSRPGNYYAIATFSSARSGKTQVVFTTSKRWFKVVEAPPKKSNL